MAPVGWTFPLALIYMIFITRHVFVAAGRIDNALVIYFGTIKRD